MNMTATDDFWQLRGRCWLFGDDLVMDYDVMDFRFVINRTMDPEELAPHLLEVHISDFHNKVSRGDVIVAGKNFGKGHAHTQGFIAMKYLGLGLIARSMPYNTFRAAVSVGLPFLTDCDDIFKFIEQGDEVEVNFSQGRVANHSQKTERQYRPMSPELLEIVSAGGLRGHLRRQLSAATGRNVG